MPKCCFQRKYFEKLFGLLSEKKMLWANPNRPLIAAAPVQCTGYLITLEIIWTFRFIITWFLIIDCRWYLVLLYIYYISAYVSAHDYHLLKQNCFSLSQFAFITTCLYQTVKGNETHFRYYISCQH